jgi:hypothetical protein
MKIAALYDVHAMPWALEPVLAEVDAEADAIVFGGDMLGGPCPRETLGAEIDNVLYCHATPADDMPMTTAVTPRASGWPGGEEFIAENLLVAIPREQAIEYLESLPR